MDAEERVQQIMKRAQWHQKGLKVHHQFAQEHYAQDVPYLMEQVRSLHARTEALVAAAEAVLEMIDGAPCDGDFYEDARCTRCRTEELLKEALKPFRED